MIDWCINFILLMDKVVALVIVAILIAATIIYTVYVALINYIMNLY